MWNYYNPNRPRHRILRSWPNNFQHLQAGVFHSALLFLDWYLTNCSYWSLKTMINCLLVLVISGGWFATEYTVKVKLCESNPPSPSPTVIFTQYQPISVSLGVPPRIPVTGPIPNQLALVSRNHVSFSNGVSSSVASYCTW